ncbi:hypothetical protein BJ742DRAFT_798285 [Cladochytrium replicatum]|nr:hypothetical protein BJ742DRAFT_798285 [Cladochytrium replicatum]
MCETIKHEQTSTSCSQKVIANFRFRREENLDMSPPITTYFPSLVGSPTSVSEAFSRLYAQSPADLTTLLSYYESRRTHEVVVAGTTSKPKRKGQDDGIPTESVKNAIGPILYGPPGNGEEFESDLVVHDLSFFFPRKKLDLRIGPAYVTLSKPNTTGSSVDLSFPVANVSHLLVLPTAQKTKPHWTFGFVVISATSISLGKSRSDVVDVIMFGIEDKEAISVTRTGDGARSQLPPSPDRRSSLASLLIQILRNAALVEPDPKLFTPVLQRKLSSEKQQQFGVYAFCGTKDGHIYLLPNGIFFGFKKPVMFFRSEDIISVEISKPRKTFNITINYHPPASGNADEAVVKRRKTDEGHCAVEFMIMDEAEHEGVAKYLIMQQFGHGHTDFKNNWQPQTPQAASNPELATAFEEDDDDDDDFRIDDEDDDVREEFDSDHQTDNSAEGERKNESDEE